MRIREEKYTIKPNPTKKVSGISSSNNHDIVNIIIAKNMIAVKVDTKGVSQTKYLRYLVWKMIFRKKHGPSKTVMRKSVKDK